LWQRGAGVSRRRRPVPGPREPAALDLWADRASVAAFDFESSRTRACLTSRRAMISPTRPAITWPAPDAPRRHVSPRVSMTRYPTISPGRRLAASARRTTDPRSDRRRFPRRAGASGTQADANARLVLIRRSNIWTYPTRLSEISTPQGAISTALLRYVGAVLIGATRTAAFAWAASTSCPDNETAAVDEHRARGPMATSRSLRPTEAKAPPPAAETTGAGPRRA